MAELLSRIARSTILCTKTTNWRSAAVVLAAMSLIGGVIYVGSADAQERRQTQTAAHALSATETQGAQLAKDGAAKDEVLRSLNGEDFELTDNERRIATSMRGKAEAAGEAGAGRALAAKTAPAARSRRFQAARRDAGRPTQSVSSSLAQSVTGQAQPQGFAIAAPASSTGPALFMKDNWRQPAMRTTPQRSGSTGAKPAMTARTTETTGAKSKTTMATGVIQAQPKRSSGAAAGPSTQVTTGTNDRPKVVRYSCCDGVNVYSGTSLTGPTVGALNHSDMVWVYNILGTGAPSGIAACGGAAASCGTLWAEAFVPTRNISGYIPLNALFIRPIDGKPGKLVFEAGYGKIVSALKQGVQSGVVSPPSCGDPSNTIVLKGQDYGHVDSYFSLTRSSRQTCTKILTTPCSYALASCEEMSASDARAHQCIYAEDELNLCEDGDEPERSAGSGNYMCLKSCPIGRAPCSDCRAWYAATGQDQTGWMTGEALVDQCLASIDPAECAAPGGGFPGGGGGGGGGGGSVDVPTGSDQFGAEGGGDSDPDPGPKPMPDPVPMQKSKGLAAAGQTQGAASNCMQTCIDRTQSWRTAMCGQYIGPVDERRFGDIKDYECGELPIGYTHPGYRENTDTGKMTGAPDENWKALTTLEMPGGKVAVVKLGRLGKQRAFSYQNLDLTTGAARSVSAPATMDARDFWLAFRPERTTVRINKQDVMKDTLFVDACIHLPGDEIDGGSVTYHPTDKMYALIREIDLGRAEYSRIKMCAVARIYLDDAYNPKLDWVDIYDVDFILTGDGLSGVDVKYGPAVLAAAAVLPVLRYAIATSLVTAKTALAVINHTDFEVTLANYVIELKSDKLAKELLPDVKSAIIDALDSAKMDGKESLQDLCGKLDPNVNQSHPYYYFYKFLRWQCDGMTSSHSFRPFQPNDASVDNGCYDDGAFVTPADANANRWWKSYQGQQWAWPWWPDSGCRLGARISSNIDKGLWPTMSCATLTFNSWLNNGPQPAGASLSQMISNNCRQAGINALTGYYGNGQDLIDLYLEANPGGLGVGGVTSND